MCKRERRVGIRKDKRITMCSYNKEKKVSNSVIVSVEEVGEGHADEVSDSIFVVILRG